MSKELSNAVQAAVEHETAYNWAAMFTAFASGSSLEDIAATFACPLPILRRAATTQDWAAIASRLTAPVPVQPKPETEGRMALLEANRAKNYALADMLRDRLIHDFGLLRAGTLRVDKALVSKGQVVHADVEPGPQDLVALANAAKSVADMTYRALGDVTLEERGAGGGRGTDPTSITVILPTVVAAPTLADAAAPRPVIDLRPTGKSIEIAVEESKAGRAKAISGGVSDPTEL